MQWMLGHLFNKPRVQHNGCWGISLTSLGYSAMDVGGIPLTSIRFSAIDVGAYL